jgi:hypothetical protein
MLYKPDCKPGLHHGGEQLAYLGVHWSILCALPLSRRLDTGGFSKSAVGGSMRGFILAVVLGTFCGAITAQTAPNSPLSAYVGTYVDRPGHTLEIVAGDQLFAVQDEGKYLLRPSGIDEFTTLEDKRLCFHGTPRER